MLLVFINSYFTSMLSYIFAYSYVNFYFENQYRIAANFHFHYFEQHESGEFTIILRLNKQAPPVPGRGSAQHYNSQ